MNFHNRSTVDEVIARGSTPRFLRHSVYVLWCNGCDIRLAIKRLWMEHPAILLHVTKLVHSFHCIALHCISFLVLYIVLFCCTVHYCLFSFLIFGLLATSPINWIWIWRIRHPAILLHVTKLSESFTHMP